MTAALPIRALVPAIARPRTVSAAANALAGWTAFNVVYLAVLCPHDLAPDEAHYWHWSRHLDWSYYSKGPLVAWLIRAGCEIFGDTAFAVRLPAALSSTLLLAGLYVLTRDVLSDARFALRMMLGAMTLPGINAGAVVMTIDPPFLACWCWALVALHRAMSSNLWKWWLLAATCTALGVLAKYPMLMMPVIAVVARPCLRGGLVLGGAILGFVPIVVWNMEHEWVSLRHVMAQVGGYGGDPLGYLGGQAGVLLGVGLAFFLAAAWRYRQTSDSGLSLMWWASVPVWGLFLVASFRTPGQVNWPAAAYIGGFVLVAAWLKEHGKNEHVRRGVIALLVLGAMTSVGLRFPALYRPVLSAVLPQPSEDRPMPVRRFDPAARLAGWRALGAKLDELRDRCGDDPLLAGMTWTLPGELSFYCRGNPEAYSFGSALGDRHSQYDLWPNPVADPEGFRGRTFLYVGDEIPNGLAIFDSVEGPIRVMHTERGVRLATWTVWICRGYSGFPPRRDPESY